MFQTISNWQVNVMVTDVDEPPVFSESTYTFTVLEEQMVTQIGRVQARDPDKANRNIQYDSAQKLHNKITHIVAGVFFFLLIPRSICLGTRSWTRTVPSASIPSQVNCSPWKSWTESCRQRTCFKLKRRRIQMVGHTQSHKGCTNLLILSRKKQ